MMMTQPKCTNRIPDHTDSWPCERPVLRADRCAECLPGEVRCVRQQLAEAEAEVAELRARLADLEGPPDPEDAPTDWDDLDVEDDVLLAEVARRGLAVVGEGDGR